MYHQIFQNRPVKHMIIVEILSREEIAKDSTQISIRRCLTEVKGADVVEIGSVFFRERSSVLIIFLFKVISSFCV